MGLDMYLNKHVYVGANYEHRNVEGTVNITVAGKPLSINFDKITYIIEEGVYWRKANAIHQWFVDNCQGGLDECQTAYVSREKLEELLSVCKSIKKNHVLAGELLPTQSGFFFGGTEYDEWYFESIDYTIRELTALLADENIDHCEFYYQSSW